MIALPCVDQLTPLHAKDIDTFDGWMTTHKIK
jgi:hypothetical protein